MHWRDHFNSSLLGAYSLYNEKTDDFNTVNGYIIRTATEEHILGASGKRVILVAYTSLDAKKPLKINVTIAKVISLIAKSQSTEKWVNVPVTFYVDKKVNTKEGVVEALRVKKQVGQPSQELTTKPVTTAQIEAVKKLIQAGDAVSLERAKKSHEAFCKPPFVILEADSIAIKEMIEFYDIPKTESETEDKA